MSVAVATLLSLRALPGAALQRSSRLLMSAIVVPTPPAPFVSVDRHSAFLDDILQLEAELSARNEGRTAAYATARAVQNAASLAIHRRHAGDAAGAAAKLSEAADGLALLLPHRSSSEEDVGLSAAIQQVCVAHVFNSFLATGTLGARPVASAANMPEPPPPPRAAGAKSATRPTEATEALPGYTDDEWLGALISSAHEIGRYAAAAATSGDAASVGAAKRCVGALHEAMAA